MILTYGVYAKGLSYQEGYPLQWEKMVDDHPEILEGSTNKYQNWEITDPERWVPHGYAVVRVDSRGAGWSPGFMDPASPREIDDLYQCIEWAGTQPWSNGKVGMLGISYYASNQWRVAGKHPPHLAAIIPWEGQNDRYRDSGYHGGILCQFQEALGQAPGGERPVRPGRTGQEKSQHRRIGRGAGHAFRRGTGEEPRRRLRRTEEASVRRRLAPLALGRSLEGTHAAADLRQLGRPGHPSARQLQRLHRDARRQQKWLEVHGDSHWSLFSSGYGLALQKRFFDYFLKGIDNGWEKQPRVQLNIRHPGEKFVLRHENEWPLARTQWTKFYLDPDGMTLSIRRRSRRQAKVEYEALGNGVTFSTPPLEKDTEITGPMAAKLFISSTTKDADLFVIVRVFDPAGQGADLHGLHRSEHAHRQRLAARLAPPARSAARANPTGPTTRTTGSSR